MMIGNLRWFNVVCAKAGCMPNVKDSQVNSFAYTKHHLQGGFEANSGIVFVFFNENIWQSLSSQ